VKKKLLEFPFEGGRREGLGGVVLLRAAEWKKLEVIKLLCQDGSSGVLLV